MEGSICLMVADILKHIMLYPYLITAVMTFTMLLHFVPIIIEKRILDAMRMHSEFGCSRFAGRIAVPPRLRLSSVN